MAELVETEPEEVTPVTYEYVLLGYEGLVEVPEAKTETEKTERMQTTQRTRIKVF